MKVALYANVGADLNTHRGCSRKCFLRFSFVTCAKYKSITVEQIAKAIIATSLNTPAKSDVYQYPEMMALNR